MEKEDWQKIQEKNVEILRDLEAEKVVEYLYQDEIFHMGDKERVKHEVTSKDKAIKLLRILERKIDGYRSFYLALNKVQPHLAHILRPPSSTPTKNPVTYIRGLYEEASEAQVPLSEIQDELHRYTGETWNVAETKKLIEQAFDMAFFVKGKNKKEKQVLNIKRRDDIQTQGCTTQDRDAHKDDSKEAHVSLTESCTLLPNIVTWTVEKLCEQLQIWADRNNVDLSFLEVIKREDIDGRVLCEMKEEDLKELFPDMPFGHRKKLHLFRTEFECETDDGKVDKRREEQLEEFDKAAKPTSFYKRHSIVRGKETRVTNMIDPVHKFVGSETYDSDENFLTSMASEVVSFSAACLNSRTNGTMHFGIKSNGEIMGMQLDETEFREKFDKALEERFFQDQHSIVKRTIRPPKSIEVLQYSDTPKLCVVQIDVVPSFSSIGEEAFFIRTLSKSKKKQNATQLIVFDQDELKELVGDDIRKYMDQKRSLSEERNREEIKALNKRKDTHCPDLNKKFMQLFCGGMGSLGGSDLYPILVCGKPDDKSRATITDEGFDFLRRRDWTVVLDLDDFTIKDKSLYTLYEMSLSQTTTVLTSDDFDPRSSENADDKNR